MCARSPAQANDGGHSQLAIDYVFSFVFGSCVMCVSKHFISSMVSIKMNARPPQTNETAENMKNNNNEAASARLKLNTSQFRSDGEKACTLHSPRVVNIFAARHRMHTALAY